MTTTETPSMDCGHLADGGECIECMAPPSEEEQWRENVLRSVARYSLSATPARGRAVEDALERYATAVRAEAIGERDAMQSRAEAAEGDWQEAIRERDEAIALLRKVTGTLEWALDYDKDDFGDRGFLHEEFPEEFRDAVEEASAARSFLSRFPEGGEG